MPISLLMQQVVALLNKGDFVGHPFRGNQWTEERTAPNPNPYVAVRHEEKHSPLMVAFENSYDKAVRDYYKLRDDHQFKRISDEEWKKARETQARQAREFTENVPLIQKKIDIEDKKQAEQSKEWIKTQSAEDIQNHLTRWSWGDENYMKSLIGTIANINQRYDTQDRVDIMTRPELHDKLPHDDRAYVVGKATLGRKLFEKISNVSRISEIGWATLINTAVKSSKGKITYKDIFGKFANDPNLNPNDRKKLNRILDNHDLDPLPYPTAHPKTKNSLDWRNDWRYE